MEQVSAMGSRIQMLWYTKQRRCIGVACTFPLTTHTLCFIEERQFICLSANRLITMSCPYAAAISSLCMYFKLTVPAAEGQGHGESHIHQAQAK